MKKLFSIFLFLSLIFIGACDVRRGNLNVNGLEINSYKFQIMPPLHLVYKDAGTVTIKAGNYYVEHGNLINLASDADWKFDGSGGAYDYGLDTGSETSDTYYSIYMYYASSSLGIVGSATLATGLYDTDLNGDVFDQNLYLGTIKNDSSSNIIYFSQIGNIMMIRKAANQTSSSTSYTDIDPADIPSALAAMVIGTLYTNDDARWAYASHDCTTDDYQTRTYTRGMIYVAPQSDGDVCVKTENAAANVVWASRGYIDKWLP